MLLCTLGLAAAGSLAALAEADAAPRCKQRSCGEARAAKERVAKKRTARKRHEVKTRAWYGRTKAKKRANARRYAQARRSLKQRRSARRSRRARDQSVYAAYVPHEVTVSVPLPDAIPPPDPIMPPDPPFVPPDAHAPDDIVERESDRALIVETARTLASAHLEQTISIVEIRDPDTGTISHRFVEGRLNKSSIDSAEYRKLKIKPHERHVADVHNHPEIEASDHSLNSLNMAERQTRANFYPGVLDFAAIVKRGVVTAICLPDGSVMMLRRVQGKPNIEVVAGASVPPLSEAESRRLDVAYLYAQGYLHDGAWIVPGETSRHAGGGAAGMQTR